MNKSTIEAGQPEQVTVNEQKADIIPSAQVSANAVLAAGIMEALTGDWSWSDGRGEFDAYWFGYTDLQGELNRQGIKATVREIKKMMKQLAKENKVELRPTYDEDYKLCGRGWFACR